LKSTDCRGSDGRNPRRNRAAIKTVAAGAIAER
jgi:hypothetical protein